MQVKTFTATVAQLTTAQVRGSSPIGGGMELRAKALDGGGYKYVAVWPCGLVAQAWYAPNSSLSAAVEAFEDSYAEE
jgi:hypothetical protein